MEDPVAVARILIRKGDMTAAAARFTAWRMLAIAFLAQNCAIGIALGSYGTLITSLQTEFNTSRSLASTGLSVMLLVLGLMSPFMGGLLTRFSIRTVMVAGAVLNMVGYLLLAQANSIYMVLAIYAALLGPGYCMLGIIAPATLISRWFTRHRGKALGVMNMPLFLASVSPIAAFLTIHYSLQSAYLLFAGVFALLLPLLLTIVDRPPAAAAEAGAAVSEGGAQTGLNQYGSSPGYAGVAVSV
jgi:MFS family permease